MIVFNTAEEKKQVFVICRNLFSPIYIDGHLPVQNSPAHRGVGNDKNETEIQCSIRKLFPAVECNPEKIVIPEEQIGRSFHGVHFNIHIDRIKKSRANDIIKCLSIDIWIFFTHRLIFIPKHLFESGHILAFLHSGTDNIFL